MQTNDCYLTLSMLMSEEIHNAYELPHCLLCRQEGKPLYTGLSDRLYQAPGKWSYTWCPRCGLVWLNPTLPLGDLNEFYAKCYGRAGTEDASSSDYRRFLKEMILAGSFGYGELVPNSWQRWLGWLCGRFAPLRNRIGRGIMFLDGRHRGRLLDVGCGTGARLSSMRQLGWEVAGIEPAADAVAIAWEKFGLQISVGTLEELRFHDETFDAMTMHHVLEHLTDPVGTLNECFRILRPGGQIVIVTPNVKSLCHTIFQKSWAEIAPPWHTYLWSPSSLRSCIEKIGFTIVRCHTMIRFDKCVQSWMIRKLHVSQRFDPLELKRILRYEPWRILANVVDTVGSSTRALGDEIVIVAKKGGK